MICIDVGSCQAFPEVGSRCIAFSHTQLIKTNDSHLTGCRSDAIYVLCIGPLVSCNNQTAFSGPGMKTV